MCSNHSVARILEIFDGINDCETAEFVEKCLTWFDELAGFLERLPLETFSLGVSSLGSLSVARASAVALGEFFVVAKQYPVISKEIGSTRISKLFRALVELPIWFDEWTLLGVSACIKHFPGTAARGLSEQFFEFAIRCANNCQQEIVRKRLAYSIALIPRAIGIGEQASLLWSYQATSLLIFAHDAVKMLVETHSIHEKECSVDENLKNRLGQIVVKDEKVVKFMSQLQERILSTNLDNLQNKLLLFLDIFDAIFWADVTGITVSFDLQHLVEFFNCLRDSLLTLNTGVVTMSHKVLRLATARFVSTIAEQILPQFSVEASPVADALLRTSLSLLNTADNDDADLAVPLLKLIGAIFKHVGLAAAVSCNTTAPKLLERFDNVLSFGSSSKKSKESCNANDPSSSDNRKRKAKKRRAALIEEFTSDHFVVKNVSERRNVPETFCRTLTDLLENAGCMLKTKDYRRLQQSVCQKIALFQRDQTKSESYGGQKVEEELYQLLTACVLCRHPYCPPALQCAVTLFESGLVKANDSTATLLRNSLAICDALSKPRLPYLEAVLAQDLDTDDEEEECDWNSAAKQVDPNGMETMDIGVDESPHRNDSVSVPPPKQDEALQIDKTAAVPQKKHIVEINLEDDDDDEMDEMDEMDEIVEESTRIMTTAVKPIKPDVRPLQGPPEKFSNDVQSMLKDFMDYPAENICIE